MLNKIKVLENEELSFVLTVKGSALKGPRIVGSPSPSEGSLVLDTRLEDNKVDSAIISFANESALDKFIEATLRMSALTDLRNIKNK